MHWSVIIAHLYEQQITIGVHVHGTSRKPNKSMQRPWLLQFCNILVSLIRIVIPCASLQDCTAYSHEVLHTAFWFSSCLMMLYATRAFEHVRAPMELCSPYRCAVKQQKCTTALFKANALPTVQCCTANQAHSKFVSLQLHLWRFAFHTGVQ